MTSYIERFKEMVAELKAHPEVQLINLFVKRGLPEDRIQAAERS